MADSSAPERSALAGALGRLPSGLYILSARDGDHASGMLASWVQQAGFEPPMLTVAVHRDRFLAAWVETSGRFALSQVRAGQKGLMKRFARSLPPEESPFDGLAVRQDAEGGPVLDEALAYLDCKVVGRLDSGDHRVYLAEVVAGAVLAPGEEPFLHVRQNGFHY